MKKLYVIEGMDRAGKDTLVSNLLFEGVTPIKINEFCRIDTGYYDVTREMFKEKDVSFVSRIGCSMAIAEFMQMIAFMRESEEEKFAVSRSFVSTAVYDLVRGVDIGYVESFFEDIMEVFDVAQKTEIFEMHLVRLFVNPETMILRGSDVDSFEIKNYHRIESAFMDLKNSGMFTSEKTFWTDLYSEDDIIDFFKESFLFT